jgi:hypothetical protein
MQREFVEVVGKAQGGEIVQRSAPSVFPRLSRGFSPEFFFSSSVKFSLVFKHFRLIESGGADLGLTYTVGASHGSATDPARSAHLYRADF